MARQLTVEELNALVVVCVQCGIGFRHDMYPEVCPNCGGTGRIKA